MVERSCPHVAVAWLQQTTPAFMAEGEAFNIMEQLTDVFVIKIQYYNYYKEKMTIMFPWNHLKFNSLFTYRNY